VLVLLIITYFLLVNLNHNNNAIIAMLGLLLALDLVIVLPL